MAAILIGALTGAIFGFVLYKVGAIRYSRVIGMLTFADSKIMKFAFTAIAVASCGYGAASLFGFAESSGLVPRIMPYLGGAHVLGGLIFGTTMALSGYCPGACVAKAGSKTRVAKFSAISAVLGLLAGVFFFDLLKEPLVSSGILLERPVPITLHGALGISYGPLAITFGLIIALFAVLADRFIPEKRFEPAQPPRTTMDRIRGEWHWLPSGIIAGLVVVWSTAQGGYLGFSGSILAVYGWVAHGLGIATDLVPAINDAILWRVALIVGVAPGALIAAYTSTKSKARAAAKGPVEKHIDLAANGKAFMAGAGTTLGAMIGGGCTTGAFMAAFPTLSVGSFAMGGTFFVVSMAAAFIVFFRNRNARIAEIQSIGDRAYN